MKIIVCPLNAAQAQIDLHEAGHVISVLSPDMPHQTFSGIAPAKHLRLSFHDVAAATGNLEAPRLDHARLLVDFISDWPQQTPLLIHCWAGISRSTAAAFSAMCILRPEETERDLAFELRAAAPSATPNPLITAHVDQLLQREGRMTTAVAAIGRGANAFEGTPFILEV
jgi:predicted protein tyrosine phosphatase